jgi:hypothetical protein
MPTDHEALFLYRRQATALRDQAAGMPSLRLRRAALKMAGEYEWRAQCVEDALRFQGVLTRDRAVVPSQSCA